MFKKYKFPYEFEDFTDEEKQLLPQYYMGVTKKLVSTKYCCPEGMEKYGSDIFNFEPRRDDIWLIGYPRCGTTLVQEILYLLGTDLNYEKAAEKIMDERFPVLEKIIFEPDTLQQDDPKQQNFPSTADEEKLLPQYVKLTNTSEKRFIKSHYGFDLIHPELLEVGCKVIFITRNIKDCLLSVYNYPVAVERKGNDAENIYEMFQYYRRNLDPMGNYFEVLKAAWERRHNKNLLFLYYEKVVEDKRKAVLEIADFLGKKLTENQLNELLNHLSMENFKKNKSLNNDYLVDAGVFVKTEKYSFIGQGKVGKWRDIFPKEMNDEMDDWIKSELNEIPNFELPDFWKEAMDLK